MNYKGLALFLAVFCFCGPCLAQTALTGAADPLDNTLPTLDSKIDKTLITGGTKTYAALGRMFVKGRKPDLADISGVYLGHMLDKQGQHWYRILPVFAAENAVLFMPNAPYPQDHSPYRDRNHVRMSFVDMASWIATQPPAQLMAVAQPSGYRYEAIPSELRQYKDYLLLKDLSTRDISLYSRKRKVLSPVTEESLRVLENAVKDKAAAAQKSFSQQ